VSITSPFSDWDKGDLANIRQALREEAAETSVNALIDAVSDYKLTLVTDLTQMSPTENGAEYAQVVGKIAALEEVPQILQGLLEEGEQAEDDLRPKE
jgi:hypothetical protein